MVAGRLVGGGGRRASPVRSSRAGRTPTCSATPDASDTSDALRARYSLLSREVEIDGERSPAGPLAAYLTEEQRDEARPSRACLLLPGASGWRHPPTRRLADRLAVFCSCLVLVPDLWRAAAPSPPCVPQSSEEYAGSLGSLPPERVAADVRASTIYLRADHRVGPVALVGVRLGGAHVLEQMGGPGGYAAAAVLCPSVLPRFAAESPPLLAIFDSGGEQDSQAREASAALAAFVENRRKALEAERVLELEEVTREGDGAPPGRSGAAPSKSALRRWRVADLRQRLQELGLPTKGLKQELVGSLYEALQREELKENMPVSGQYKLAAGTGASQTEKVKHLILQFPGASRWCDSEGECPTTTPNASVRVSSSEELETNEFKEGDFGRSPGSPAVNATEDAMLMVEAWLNFHLDTKRAI
ncbi:hypothetical protein AB1Y20_015314 [Prymnesium parvum]|uniref:SAP domain-containing protein n=1 Tax=Prymnesium parvum TaxID=97485 RepID=A0AB34JY51_PRYPA